MHNFLKTMCNVLNYREKCQFFPCSCRDKCAPYLWRGDDNYRVPHFQTRRDNSLRICSISTWKWRKNEISGYRTTVHRCKISENQQKNKLFQFWTLCAHLAPCQVFWVTKCPWLGTVGCSVVRNREKSVKNVALAFETLGPPTSPHADMSG